MVKNKKTIEIYNFSQIINDYISYKRSLGYKANNTYLKAYQGLGRFLSRYSNTSQTVLNSEIVNAYIYQGDGKNKSRTIHNRMSMIRQLAMFMNMTNPGNYVFPKERIIKIQKNDFIPYIFSLNEVKLIDTQFKNLTSPAKDPFKSLVFLMLFRVLYCTGIRISEALNLQLEDVDLDNGFLLIGNSKNNHERLVPMSLSLWEEMKKYEIDMNFSTGCTVFVFPIASGTNYKNASVLLTFRQVYEECNIYNEKGNLPRIHDLRHTFCTHALEQMVERGTDVYCALPYLCEYVGHRDISSTNTYLRLIPERFSSISNQMEKYCENLIPEVLND